MICTNKDLLSYREIIIYYDKLTFYFYYRVSQSKCHFLLACHKEEVRSQNQGYAQYLIKIKRKIRNFPKTWTNSFLKFGPLGSIC